MAEPSSEGQWGLVLAGGNGTRLRPLTRKVAGDDRPKQFCRILGDEPLLEQTRRRVERLIPRDRTLTIVTRAHERYYEPLLADAPPWSVVVQPRNRGTAPAMLYALLRLAGRAAAASVAVFPSDHYVSDDGMFMAHVSAAFEAIQSRRELVVLLGIVPECAEVEYGWIEPAEPVPGTWRAALFRVRRFWEKPSRDLAEALLDNGCLWNSFVMVGHVSAFLSLIASALPDLHAAFSAVRPALGTFGEPEAVRALYATLPETDFSRAVLGACPANLAVLPVSGTEWSDLGEPRRVLATLAGVGIGSNGAPAAAAPLAVGGPGRRC